MRRGYYVKSWRCYQRLGRVVPRARRSVSKFLKGIRSFNCVRQTFIRLYFQIKIPMGGIKGYRGEKIFFGERLHGGREGSRAKNIFGSNWLALMWYCELSLLRISLTLSEIYPVERLRWRLMSSANGDYLIYTRAVYIIPDRRSGQPGQFILDASVALGRIRLINFR